MVGLIVLTDADGRIIFDRNYGEEGVTEDFWSLIEVEGGGYLMGGARNRPTIFTAQRVDANGDPIWWNDYGGDQNSRCHAVVELKAGDFVLAGWSHMFGDTLAGVRGINGYVCKVSRDGDLIWQWAYGGPSSDEFYSMRETAQGILLAGVKGGDGWLCMIDDETGEFIWDRTYSRDEAIRNHYDMFNGLISCREGGFLAVGVDAVLLQDNNQSWQWVIRFNNVGERLWEQTYDLEQNGYPRSFWSAQQMPDEGFALVGAAATRGAQMLRIDRDGQELWQRFYPNQNGQPLRSVILYTVLLTDIEELVACGYGGVQNEQGAGLLLKLRPERSAPMIIRQYPDSNYVRVLTGDSLFFDVDVIDSQNDELRYEWRIEREVISTDTCDCIAFDQSGVFNLECWVSDGEEADSADWGIDVRDLFIVSYSPDTLSLALRRGTTQTFSLDSIAAVDGDSVQYQWTLRNLDDQTSEETGVEAGTTIDFLTSANYRLEGLAYRWETSDSIVWTIAVRSAILDFLPKELHLSVPADSLVNFEVYPFNPESDSLSYRWDEDGDSVGGDWTVGLRFAYNGQAGRSTYAVSAIVMDGAEVDTVTWTVTVQDPNATPPTPPSIEVGGNPLTFGIVSITPNPFNSSTTIRFSVPSSSSSSAQSASSAVNSPASAVRLSLHDLTGREVRKCISAEVQAGEHTYTLNGANLPAGVYLLRLEAGGACAIQKLVLIR